MSEEVWIPAVFGCPTKSCEKSESRSEDNQWVCKSDRSPLSISNFGNMRCEMKNENKFSHIGFITRWKFSCVEETHIDVEAITADSFIEALRAGKFFMQARKKLRPYDFFDEIIRKLRDRELLDKHVTSLSHFGAISGRVLGSKKEFQTLLNEVKRPDGYESYVYSWNDERFDPTKKKELLPLFEDDKITDTAMETCSTILDGFENIMSRSLLVSNEFIPFIRMNRRSAELQNELDKNSTKWNIEGHLKIHGKLKSVRSLLKAIETSDYHTMSKIFYQNQYQHDLIRNAKPYDVGIFIDGVDEGWIPHIKNSIAEINDAAPGLNLYENENFKIIIKDEDETKCFTRIFTQPVKVNLGKLWPEDKRKGTSTHELLHALGFMHEFQRYDAENQVIVQNNGPNYETIDYGMLTRFDPFSIMMYSEGSGIERHRGDPIWEVRGASNKGQSDALSELNKVSLNLVYPPCVRDWYNPKINENYGLLYCGRDVMHSHNQTTPPSWHTKCGPYGPNCPACRVFKGIKNENDRIDPIEKVERIVNDNRWQGLSGSVFCGQKYDDEFYTERSDTIFKSDGLCGPDQGWPCQTCGQELNTGYDHNELKVTKNKAQRSSACVMI